MIIDFCYSHMRQCLANKPVFVFVCERETDSKKNIAVPRPPGCNFLLYIENNIKESYHCYKL